MASCLYFILSLLSLIFAALSIAGVHSGWAYGHLNTGEDSKWAPNIHLIVREGWLTYTATADQPYLPVDFPELEGTAAKVVGIVMVSIAGVAILASVFLSITVASKQGMLPSASFMVFCSTAVQAQVAFIAAGLYYAASIALYLDLAINTYQKTKDALGDNLSIFPLPSWAFASAMASASCILAMGVVKQQMGLEQSPEGYEPV